MLKTQITGAKYLSPQTNQMTNLNIAVPADSKDTEFGTSDILLAKDVVKLGENSPQIQAIKENIDTVNNTLNDINSDMSELKNKVSKISTELFKIVTELPEAADADKNKIYCILTVNQIDNENKYIEYIAIEEDSVWKWEKIGEFKAEPDLSGYAKLSGAAFTGDLRASSTMTVGGVLSVNSINKYDDRYLQVLNKNDKSNAKVFATDGSIADLSTKANVSDILLKKGVYDSGYCIGSNSNRLGADSLSTNNTVTSVGNYSLAEGFYTIAMGLGSHAQGVYNVLDSNAIHSVGIGNPKTRKTAEYIYAEQNILGDGISTNRKSGYKYIIGVGGYDGISTDITTYKSVQEVIADLTSRIEQLETKVKALEDANTPA